MSNIQTLATPVGRILIAALFLMAGIGKISGYEGTQGYMEAAGVPGALLPLVIATEILGAILIIVGWKVRQVALALAGYTLLIALLFHFDFGDRAQTTHFLKNLAITGGFLFLFVNGAGAYSLDNREK